MNQEPTPSSSEEYPSSITLPVQWGEQDAFGHVNNVVYFRWFESSRIAYMNSVGLDDLMKSEQIGPILARIECDYRRQLTFPETVRIDARVVRIGRSSIDMEHQVWSQSQSAIVANGHSTLVVFDYQGQCSVPVPESIRAAIADLEGREF